MSDVVLVLRHRLDIGPGHLGTVLAAAGVPTETVRFDAGGRLPTSLDFRAVVSLGGHMGAYDVAKFPWLEDEKRFLADAVRAGLPVLGICLGCQLLADALGGRAFQAAAPEVAVAEVTLTPAGEQDLVARHLGSSFMVWHEDTWELPEDGELLAATDHHPQAFRYGSALGIQPHPEVTVDTARSWAAASPLVVNAGRRPDEFLAEIEEQAADLEAGAYALFEAWLESV